MKKRFLPVLLVLAMLLPGCSDTSGGAQIAATTLPVYQFTTRLCQGTPLEVTRLVTENTSCLHDYTLQVSQMRAIEAAKVVAISGAGLETFLSDALTSAQTVVDASEGIVVLQGDEGDDPHIWLSPVAAKQMAENLCAGLSQAFPEYAAQFESSLSGLCSDLDELQQYGEQMLSQLRCRELITFHDGFAYFAQAFDLTILAAVEEESGSEASASELSALIAMVREQNLPAIFTETNGSDAAAQAISRETGCAVFTLDMAMSGDDYFAAMYHNINTIREALG